MKKLSIFLCVTVSAFLLQAHSCHKDSEYPSTCGDIACTMIFAMVSVEVKDNNGHALVLDEYYTIREKDGEKIVTQSSIPTDGTYVVLDDNFISTLTNKTELFRFIGKKNGVEVVNEVYEIQGDCCHVSKKSGSAVITVP